MENFVVEIATRGVPNGSCVIEWMPEAEGVAMTARAASVGIVNIRAANVFEALVKLRLQLEGSDCLLLCNAARKDAYPSRMLLEMGGGRKSYLLHQGKPASKEDLIDLFEPATHEQVGTVAEQRRGYEEWLRSLK